MTVSTLLITAAYPLDKHTSCFVIVRPDFKVSKIVENALKQLYPSFMLNPSDYGLYVLPQKQWLFPNCNLSDYEGFFSPQKICKIILKPRNIVTININCLHYKCMLSCDPNQLVSELLCKKVHSFFMQHLQDIDRPFFDWDEWSIWEEGKWIPDEVPCAQLNMHTVQLRRENPVDELCRIGPEIFKRPLSEVILRENIDNRNAIPSFVEILFQKIEMNLNVEGIFRKSGLQAKVEDIISHVDQSNNDRSFNMKKYIFSQQIHDVVGVLKAFLRMLPEPLISELFYEQLSEVSKIPDLNIRLPRYKCVIDSMPSENCAILKRFAQCLKKVTSHSAENKMNYNNILICVMPALVRNKADMDQMALLNLTKSQAVIGCDIFQYYKFIFGNKKFSFFSSTVKCISKDGVVQEKLVQKPNNADNDNNETNNENEKNGEKGEKAEKGEIKENSKEKGKEEEEEEEEEEEIEIDKEEKEKEKEEKEKEEKEKEEKEEEEKEEKERRKEEKDKIKEDYKKEEIKEEIKEEMKTGMKGDIKEDKEGDKEEKKEGDKEDPEKKIGSTCNDLNINEYYPIVKDDKPEMYTIIVNKKHVEVLSSCFEREKITVYPFSDWIVINMLDENEVMYLPVTSKETIVGVNTEVESQITQYTSAKNILKQQISDLNESLITLSEKNETEMKSYIENFRQLLEYASMSECLF